MTLMEPPYDKLSAVLDAFIDTYGGRTRARGITTILLLQQSSLNDRGISISEVRQVTKAPLENIRRHFTKQVELGSLITRPDPDDERVTRYLIADMESELANIKKVIVGLQAIGKPDGTPSDIPRPFGKETFDALLAVLRVFIEDLGGGLRIREFKIAIVIQQATVTGTGITPSEIARAGVAPLESVRRGLQQYTETGTLKLLEDPNDDRATRVFYANPDRRKERFNRIAERLNQLDWNAFNID